MTLKIGQVASLAGVGIDTVRYYERRGVLPSAVRGKSGYRLFDDSAVERIKLVKHLQELGLTLDEIGAMTAAVVHGGADCASEARHIDVALRRTEAKLASLEALRDNLKVARRRCQLGECDLVARMKQSSSHRGCANPRETSPRENRSRSARLRAGVSGV